MTSITRSRAASHRSRRSPRKAYTSISPSQMPCADLFTTGYCKFGDSCLFSHEFDIIPQEDPSSHPPPYIVKNQFEDGHFHNSSSSTPSSSKTSPSAKSSTLPSADTPSSTNSHLPDVSTSTPRPSDKPMSKPRRKSKRLHKNGIPAYFPIAPPTHFAPGPYAPWSPPMMYNQPGLYYTWPAYLPPPASHDDGSSTRKPSVALPKVKVTGPRDSEQSSRRQTTKSPAKTSVSRPPLPAHYYLGAQAHPHPFSASQGPDVYDFDDVEEEPDNVVVEPKHDVERYLGSKVGVLGGGVKLGMVRKPSSRKLGEAEIMTKQDLTFDEEEYDDEDDEDDVQIVNRDLEAHEVPLPFSDPENEDGVEEVVPDIPKLQLDCSSDASTAVAPPPLTAATSTFSWADDEDDDSYFKSPPPFSPSTPAKEQLSPAQTPQSIPAQQEPSEPPKPLSYAAMAAAKSSKPFAKLPGITPFSVRGSDLPKATVKAPSTSASPANSTDGWTTATRFKSRAKSSSSQGSASPKRGASDLGQNGSRQRGRTVHVPGADERLIRASWAAPKIYGKLGFSMSKTEAREIELLRLVEQKRLREARDASISSH